MCSTVQSDGTVLCTIFKRFGNRLKIIHSTVPSDNDHSNNLCYTIIDRDISNSINTAALWLAAKKMTYLLNDIYLQHPSDFDTVNAF